MQFRLSSLFVLTAIAGTLSLAATACMRHWDLRSYYIGFYGPRDVPDWATGTGADGISEALGSLMAAVWQFGPWIALFGIAATLGAWGLNMRGCAR